MLLTRSALNQLTGLQVTVCVSGCVASLFCLPALHRQLSDCSGSLDECLSCVSSYGLTADHTERCPVRTRRGFTVRSCPLLSCSVPGSLTRGGIPLWLRHALVPLQPLGFEKPALCLWLYTLAHKQRFLASGVSAHCLPCCVPPGLPVTLLQLLFCSPGRLLA